jgi:4a-hydroxytetrahydrobiopterin dehydratase
MTPGKPTLSQDDLTALLRELPLWKIEDGQLVRNLEFKDFAGAMAFVNQVAGLAEQANHHPDIAISWNKVTLTLSTHSAGGLTAKDFALAREVNDLG